MVSGDYRIVKPQDWAIFYALPSKTCNDMQADRMSEYSDDGESDDGEANDMEKGLLAKKFKILIIYLSLRRHIKWFSQLCSWWMLICWCINHIFCCQKTKSNKIGRMRTSRKHSLNNIYFLTFLIN